jgi:cell division protein FtsZ
MIPYTRDPRQIIPASSVKIIGLGGAGTNMLERIALDGMEGAELLALNTDIRTLGACLAREKIQLGVNLTKGLGTGGDPELGHQAVLEAEDAIRAAVQGRRIVFLCVGLGGGTGSGAAPIVTRIAREEGAFVVVFATMPFAFEGKRRRDQAETSLNELAVLSNALVTFDNNRMGELVLAKQGVHEAFLAADHMICESMKAVIRLVIRPGLINVGLDDLMSALRTNRSRCLFGSGLANGKDRATRALRNALASPLLDQGSLLKDAQTVLVHLCGGEDLTLFEIELLMQRLQKHVPEQAHVLFGAAIDPAMGDALSLTLISALPEDSLAMAARDSLSRESRDLPLLNPSQGFIPPQEQPIPAAEPQPPAESWQPGPPEAAPPAEPVLDEEAPAPPAVPSIEEEMPAPAKPAADPASPSLFTKIRRSLGGPAADPAAPTLFDALLPLDPSGIPPASAGTPAPGPEAITPADAPAAEPARSSVVIAEFVAVGNLEPMPADPAADPAAEPISKDAESNYQDPESPGITAIPEKRPPGATPWSIAKGPKTLEPELPPIDLETPASSPKSETPKLKLGIKPATPQSELSLDSTPRGRFEGEAPNVFDGEDLDLPPFLRKKK